MAFTSVTLTGKVLLSNSTPASGASVTLTLNTPITDGTQIITPAALTARCAADGSFSLAVNANDDTTTLPTGTYYTATIVYGSTTLDTFNVVVPHADAPTVNLFTLATLPNPNVVSPYVSQIIAGTNVSLSPAGGTGIVTVSASGGGGGSSLTPTAVQSSGTYAAAIGDEVLVDISNANVTITLPTAPADKAQVGWKIVKYASTNTLTINTGGTDVFDVAAGATSQSGIELFQAKIYQYQHSTGIWIAISGDRSIAQADTRYRPTVTTRSSVSGTTALAVPALGGAFKDTLTGNTTYSAPTGMLAGVECNIELLITQDATGGHTVTWFSGISWLQGAAPTIPPGANQSLLVSFTSLDGGATWLGSYTGSNERWRVDLLPYLGYSIGQGTWAYNEAAGQVLGNFNNSTAASGDNVSYSTAFEAGTWTLWVMMVTFTNRGIMQVNIDGTLVASFDGYASSAGNNVVFTQPGINIATSGKHTIQLLSNTKNASSTAFCMAVCNIVLQRTA